jgi:hypothetical protein
MVRDRNGAISRPTIERGPIPPVILAHIERSLIFVKLEDHDIRAHDPRDGPRSGDLALHSCPRQGHNGPARP